MDSSDSDGEEETTTRRAMTIAPTCCARSMCHNRCGRFYPSGWPFDDMPPPRKRPRKTTAPRLAFFSHLEQSFDDGENSTRPISVDEMEALAESANGAWLEYKQRLPDMVSAAATYTATQLREYFQACLEEMAELVDGNWEYRR